MSATTPRLNDQYPSEPDQDRTIRISESAAVATSDEEGRVVKEDLFLDLAHTDVSMQDPIDAFGRVERRRVSEFSESAGDRCYN